MQSARKRSFLASNRGLSNVCRYIGIKVIRWRDTYNYGFNYAQLLQIGDIKFLDSQNNSFNIPLTTPTYVYACSDEKIASGGVNPTLMDKFVYDGSIRSCFDNNTSTKLCRYTSYIHESSLIPSGADQWKKSDGTSLIVRDGGNYTLDYWGIDAKNFPFVYVLDLENNPIDISLYSKWCFYNGNDNANIPGRTWIQGAIIASNDNKNWYELDYFFDLNITNNNYALAYTGTFDNPIKTGLYDRLDMYDYM